MSEDDVLKAIQRSNTELLEKVEKKTFWDRVLPALQALVLLAGVGWAVFTYYFDKHEKAMQPASIDVEPTIVDLQTTNGLRVLKFSIAVENKGARAFVINSPYTIRAIKMKRAEIPGRLADSALWDGSYATDESTTTLRSGEAFGRGFWFEPGERDVRSYVVAVPEGGFDLVAIHAAVRHAKVEDDALHTRWELLPDRSLKAVTVVLRNGQQEEYSRSNHVDIWRRDAIAMNDGSAELPLWSVRSSNPSTAPTNKSSAGTAPKHRKKAPAGAAG